MSTMQNLITADWTVNDVVARYPEALPVFGRYGIDACCGGLKSLREVASVHHLDLSQLLADVGAAIGTRESVSDPPIDPRPGLGRLRKILTGVDRHERRQGPGSR